MNQNGTDQIIPGPAPASVTARKPPLPALTGLRTILAVNIMLFHFTPAHIGFMAPVVNSAYVFVGFFFLISGFVLAYNYADRPILDKRRFYIARLSRIYPVYLLVLVLSIPFLKLEWHARPHQEFFQGLILTPLALQAWSPTLATFWNTVGWNVPADFLLYALFPFILIAVARFPNRLASPARVVAAILAVWIAGMLPHIWYVLTNPDHLSAPADRFTYAFWVRALHFTPPMYLGVFVAGILTARLHALLTPSPWWRSLMALAGLVGLGLFFAFAADRLPYVLIHGVLLLPFFCALLLGLAGKNPVASVFAWRPLVILGETTFALYLLHFNAFQIIHLYKLPERFHVAQYDPWISFAAIMLLALIIQRLYEHPARQFVLALATPRPQAQPR